MARVFGIGRGDGLAGRMCRFLVMELMKVEKQHNLYLKNLSTPTPTNLNLKYSIKSILQVYAEQSEQLR